MESKIHGIAYFLMLREPFVSALAVIESAFVPNNIL